MFRVQNLDSTTNSDMWNIVPAMLTNTTNINLNLGTFAWPCCLVHIPTNLQSHDGIVKTRLKAKILITKLRIVIASLRRANTITRLLSAFKHKCCKWDLQVHMFGTLAVRMAKMWKAPKDPQSTTEKKNIVVNNKNGRVHTILECPPNYTTIYHNKINSIFQPGGIV